MNSITDAEQLVGIEDDKFGISNKHFGRLIVLNGQNKGIDGVAQINGVCLGLRPIEFHHVPVIIADLFKFLLEKVRASIR